MKYTKERNDIWMKKRQIKEEKNINEISIKKWNVKANRGKNQWESNKN